VAAESNNNYRAESTIESRESMTFNIAATIVDIRPNGMLVLEARKAIRVNDNLWETSLSGVCRAQDIGPDNVVLSKDVIDLEIRKEDRGHLRDGYSRGWLQRFLDRYGLF
jgi:flagellar L-ring protein precursor FlgH